MPHPPGVRPLPFGLITVVRLIFTWTPTFLSNFHSIFPSIQPWNLTCDQSFFFGHTHLLRHHRAPSTDAGPRTHNIIITRNSATPRRAALAADGVGIGNFSSLLYWCGVAD